jgi:3-oxoacyl-[acyl-carrier-protein] synthase II
MSGIGVCSTLDLSQEPVRICGEVKDFDPTKWMTEKEARRTQRFVQLAIATSKMALQDSGLEITDDIRADVGVSIGVGVGGMQFIEDQIGILNSKGSGERLSQVDGLSPSGRWCAGPASAGSGGTNEQGGRFHPPRR